MEIKVIHLQKKTGQMMMKEISDCSLDDADDSHATVTSVMCVETKSQHIQK